MQRLVTWAAFCALGLMSIYCSAAQGQSSPWRVDDANVVFQASANAQQDAEALRNYELISRVKQLRLEGAVQQAHIDALRGYTMLGELFVDAPQLKTVAWLPLQKFSQLSGLTIRSREFTGESLDQLPQLRKLEVAGCPISLAGFKAIGSLHQLRSLNVATTGISDDELADLHDLKMLTSLSLANYGRGPTNKIAAKGLSLLGSHPFLEELNLPAFAAPSEVEQIPTLRFLKQLFVSSKTETDLRNISRFVGLEVLYVDLKTLSPESAREIARLQRLRVLNTDRCQIPAAAVAAISGCENLESFCTENEHDPGLLHMLVHLPALRKLVLVSVSDDDAKHLKKARLLQSLWIRKGATDQAMTAIAELPHLNELHLSYCTAQGIRSLKQSSSLEFLLFPAREEEHTAALKELQSARPKLEIRQRIGF